MPPQAAHHKQGHATSQARAAQDPRAPAGGCGPGQSRMPGLLGAPFDNIIAMLFGLHPDAPDNKFGCVAQPGAKKAAKKELSPEAKKILEKPTTKPKRLSDIDFQNAATKLGKGVSVEIVRAFATVESGGRSGFGADNRPIIAYEGHIFRKYSKHKDDKGYPYDKDYPLLSYPYKKKAGPEWQKNNKTQETAYQTLADAMALDYEAALMACSWGMFQVMGFNYSSCGYKNVTDFVMAIRADEAGQLDAFVGYCKMKAGMIDALAQLDYVQLATLYNGADYGDYDKRIEKEYKKLIAAKNGTPAAAAKHGPSKHGPTPPGAPAGPPPPGAMPPSSKPPGGTT